jgi:hypothetical protein
MPIDDTSAEGLTPKEETGSEEFEEKESGNNDTMTIDPRPEHN